MFCRKEQILFTESLLFFSTPGLFHFHLYFVLAQMLALVYFCVFVFVLFCVRVLLMLWCFGMTHQNAANLKELEALYVLDLQKATTLCYVINLNSIVGLFVFVFV